MGGDGGGICWVRDVAAGADKSLTGEPAWRGFSLVGETTCESALVGDVFERVGEVFNKEGDPGPSSVLADLLPTLLCLLPLKVLILKRINFSSVFEPFLLYVIVIRCKRMFHENSTLGNKVNVATSEASPEPPQLHSLTCQDFNILS